MVEVAVYGGSGSIWWKWQYIGASVHHGSLQLPSQTQVKLQAGVELVRSTELILVAPVAEAHRQGHLDTSYKYHLDYQYPFANVYNPQLVWNMV